MRKRKLNKLYKIGKEYTPFPWKISKYKFLHEYDNIFYKGSIMKNNKVYIAIAVIGFATQVFTYICGSQLNPQTLVNFNAFGMASLFLSFIGFAFNVTQENDHNRRDYEDFLSNNGRDLDSIYRHIDDVRRDMTYDFDNKVKSGKKK